MPLELFDTHCHFDFEVFDADRQSIWADGQQQGITSLLIPAVAPRFWERAVHLHQKNKGIYYALGWHPCWLAKPSNNSLSIDDLGAALINAAGQEGCVAIGECGLDLHEQTHFDLQLKVLDIHLEVARHLNKPMIFHCRRAHNELIQHLKSHAFKLPGILHAFNGSFDLAKTYIKMGLSLGVGGSITYERAQKTRETFKRLDLAHLVLETDAPDMPLNGFQGQRNSPLQLTAVAQCLADLREISFARVAQMTTQNARDLFKFTQVI